MGVHLLCAEVPLIQKMTIQKFEQAEKPMIRATQMLDSMIYSRKLTRAEVTKRLLLHCRVEMIEVEEHPRFWKPFSTPVLQHFWRL